MRLYKKTIHQLIFLAGGMIILLVLSCFLGLTLKQEKMIRHSVYLSAVRLFESIVLTRRWNAGYGGVFVLKKEGMESNPYLEHPDITSASGLTYTLKNPALMTREISHLAAQRGHYRYHITSLKLMNPNNQPDDWERASLQQFELGVSETVQTAFLHGEQVYRLMRPLMVEDGCMQCHAKQDYAVGEVRGGISVSLPYKDVSVHLESNRAKMTALGLSVAAVFSFLLYFVIWRLVGHLFAISGELGGQKQRLEELNEALDRKVSERTAALQESEQRFRSTFEQAPVGICHLDLKGHFLRVNKRFCEIFKCPEAELRYRLFQEIFPGIHGIAGVEGWNALLLGEKDSILLERRSVLRGLSEIWVNMTFSLVRDDSSDPRYLICIVEDVSERRNLEQQLQQAQKMEAMGTLAGGIAHDFNNILTPILGYTEMLMEDTQPDEKRYSSLQVIFNAAIRAKDLIRQILTFSRQSDTQIQPLHIALVVKEVVKLLHSFLPSSIQISHNYTQEECIVLANPTQIHQILMNLCTNAYQAMPDGKGILSVQLKVEDLGGDSELTLAPGRYAVLVVTDTGCGMDPQTLQRIYDPYFTTKAQGEGTGLGLAMVHGIVDELGGIILVESAVGQGTTFTVYLPLVSTSDSKTEHVNVDLAGDCRGSESILLVDDDPVIAAMVTGMLQDLGYEVVSFNGSVEALEYFREHKDAFDLVVTDIAMPELTGIMMAREMATLRVDLPIILCTGFNAEFSREMTSLTNVMTLLTKPILKHDLARAVRRALDGDLSSNNSAG